MVQIALLAEDEDLQAKLEVYGIETQTLSAGGGFRYVRADTIYIQIAERQAGTDWASNAASTQFNHIKNLSHSR